MTDEHAQFLKQASEFILDKRGPTTKYLNLFLYLHNQHDIGSKRLVDEIENAISKDFECFVDEISIQEFSPQAVGCSPSEVIWCFSVESRKIEWFRSILKSIFWQRHREDLKPRAFTEVLTTTENTAITPFRLSDYGLFVPYIIKKRREIRAHCFGHEPFYRYRLCTHKTDPLPEPFREFLYLLFEDCPNHLYQRAGFRASQQRFKIQTHITHTQQHELIELTKQSRSFTKFKSGHENVANYFLINDPQAIACEIPVWLENAELSDYEAVFHTNEPLTGHIDLLRYEDGKIVVWDYKPNARREVKAVTQVFLYALMLSVRTGISLRHFLCGYFDKRDCYTFSPYNIKRVD